MNTKNIKPPVINFDRLCSAVQQTNMCSRKGTIAKVSGLTVESNGPSLGLGELCGIHLRDGRRVLAEVVGFRDEKLILLPLEHIEGISAGDPVTARSTPRYIKLSNAVLGRVLNGLGEPIDNKGPLAGTDKQLLDSASTPPCAEKK
jgi:flagellum-specific ATP synthase